MSQQGKSRSLDTYQKLGNSCGDINAIFSKKNAKMIPLLHCIINSFA